MPTVEGEGPEYDKLRELDKKINTLEGKYSRERRPGNKANIRKEIDKLKAERDALADEIQKNPPKPKSSSSSAEQVSSSSSDVAVSNRTCGTDTIFIRDTLVIHDTLYVIIADKKKEESVQEPAIDNPDSTGTPSQPDIK